MSPRGAWVSLLSPLQRLPLGIPIKIVIIKNTSCPARSLFLPTTKRGLCGGERVSLNVDLESGLEMIGALSDFEAEGSVGPVAQAEVCLSLLFRSTPISVR